jgi:hypothetical protein
VQPQQARREEEERMKSGIALVILIVGAGCGSHRVPDSTRATTDEGTHTRDANLEMAARYPWLDDGHCVVREASNAWGVMIERCFHALDLSRLRFVDRERRCPLAQLDTAAVMPQVALCLMIAPEVALVAVVVVGTVVVAAAIAEAMAEYRKCHFCMCALNGVLYGDKEVSNMNECISFCEKNHRGSKAICK